MLKMEDYIRPHIYVALRLPAGTHKVVQLKPNTVLSLGKYGTFSVNDLLGRPFYHTYEIVESSEEKGRKALRIVPASELVERDSMPEAELSGDQPVREGEDRSNAEFEVVDQTGKVLMRTNQNIMDKAGAQKLTMAEIEELKKAESVSGRDIIAKIMESHTEIDKKTAFSLAKYSTRKANKYMRRFVPLPMDASLLAKWFFYEKEPSRIMNIREESLALLMSWSNIHYTQDIQSLLPGSSRGRWLVVDDTGGLVVAAMAERLDLLHHSDEEAEAREELDGNDETPNGSKGDVEDGEKDSPSSRRPNSIYIAAQESHMSATNNTIHLVHANAQPNLSLLAYLNYDFSNPSPSHPLHRHLKTLSWLQLLHPEEDILCAEPEIITDEELANMKSNKRGQYYRKRRRWQRTKAVVDETQAGGFDGLVICSTMNPSSPMHHLVPLLRGGAPVSIFNPTIESLAELSDCYSTARRTAFLGLTEEQRADALNEGEAGDFPVNPLLMLNPSVQKARAKPWQVLPGRTHPLMTGVGGAQGYVFTGTRVVPIEGERVEARGAFKRRKTVKKDGTNGNGSQTPATE